MARFQLFDAVVRVLAGLAARQPLLVVLDDLHWADEASLRLLRFAARHLALDPVLLLGTYRDLEAPAGLHELAAAGEVVALAGLARPRWPRSWRRSPGGGRRMQSPPRCGGEPAATPSLSASWPACWPLSRPPAAALRPPRPCSTASATPWRGAWPVCPSPAPRCWRSPR